MQRQVGRRIRELRLARGLTQEQVAERASVNGKYFGAIERGEINVTVVTIDRVAQALGVRVADLFLGQAEPDGAVREDLTRIFNELVQHGDEEKLSRLHVFLERVFR